jgi:hypothetical protein
MDQRTFDVTDTMANSRRADKANQTGELPVIFGLRYLEEEATEIQDVVGCLRSVGTCTQCDDED